MNLTGKCKEAFEKWFVNHDTLNSMMNYEAFYDFDESMKWGVYQDFFGIVNINVDVFSSIETKGYLSSVDFDTEHQFELRQDARTAAIEKANEIFNNK